MSELTTEVTVGAVVRFENATMAPPHLEDGAVSRVVLPDGRKVTAWLVFELEELDGSVRDLAYAESEELGIELVDYTAHDFQEVE